MIHWEFLITFVKCFKGTHSPLSGMPEWRSWFICLSSKKSHYCFFNFSMLRLTFNMCHSFTGHSALQEIFQIHRKDAYQWFKNPVHFFLVGLFLLACILAKVTVSQVRTELRLNFRAVMKVMYRMVANIEPFVAASIKNKGFLQGFSSIVAIDLVLPNCGAWFKEGEKV